MSTIVDAQAVRIFPQSQPRVAEVFHLPWGQEDESQFGLIPGDATCTGAAAQVLRLPSIPQGELQTTWRGHRILSEAELQRIDFPYPPEPDWQISDK